MKVEKIVIVGGGTSGWMTAAYLSKNNPEVSITVVDKEVGTPIGVGEATLINFKDFLDECGFHIDDWFSKIDTGYKAGILFTNWTKPGNELWHPFYKGNRVLTNKEFPLDVYVHDLWTLNQDLDFKTYTMGNYEASVYENKIDKTLLDTGYYGYHVDCGKLVQYIQEKLLLNPLKRIQVIRSDVISISRKDNDNIEYLKLKDGQKISGDLYIDCTGFKSLLSPGRDRVNLMGRLFCNTAVVSPVPYKDRDAEFKPYAISDAVDHGWIWKIGVASRIGSGMVFNRDITDIEEAKEYFVNYWDNRISKEKVRVIDWTPFYNNNQWSGNVVQVGLSAGFIEPLESTGIALITVGATQIHNIIREQFYDQNSIDYFNQTMKMYFEDCVDFVSAHYDRNERTTPFWNYVKEKFVPSDRMKHHIALVEKSTNVLSYRGRFTTIFNGVNWSSILIQMGFSVAPRDLPINPEYAREILIKNYIRSDKHRSISGLHHSSEIDRISEINKL